MTVNKGGNKVLQHLIVYSTPLKLQLNLHLDRDIFKSSLIFKVEMQRIGHSNRSLECSRT